MQAPALLVSELATIAVAMRKKSAHHG
jgi:hypothetical protein